MIEKLQVKNLVKSYHGFKAVDNISFEIYSGEIFSILGPNGAGKTTTMKILSGMLKSDSGNISVTPINIKLSVGICPQHIVIWDTLTCLEQLSYIGIMHGMSRQNSINKSIELLEIFGLSDKKNKLGKTLSGGMQRRLNIALALVHSPDIVFLDEPQAGLDPQSRVLVRDYIKSIKNKTTIVITTHDMDEAEKLSDRICIMDYGKILINGTLEEVKDFSSQADLIEIEINGDISKDLLPFIDPDIYSNYNIINQIITFQTKNIHNILENVLNISKQKYLQITNLNLRKKSLEDVFISLTGRRLRD